MRTFTFFEPRGRYAPAMEMTNAKPELRRLVACPACEFQYDASQKPPGSRFHCGCGELIVVPDPRLKEASVVRCSSCGGPRRGEARKCVFCGSDFTLHERDLHTVCPSCMSRISDHSRFCSHCGVAIAPQKLSQSSTKYFCPACGDLQRLSSRSLGGENLTVLECGGCAGLWLGHEVFALLQQRAVQREISWLEGNASQEDSARPEPGPLYRQCAVCRKQMSRRNFHRRSGVIVDVCPGDGVWFDLGELERILRWIQNGGMTKAAALENRRSREAATLDAVRWRGSLVEKAGAELAQEGGSPPSFIGELITFLSDGE